MLETMCSFARTTYVHFYGLGGHQDDMVVSDRLTEDLVFPAKAWGFKFYDVFTASAPNFATDGSMTQVPMKSDKVNWSPLHYIGGELFTLEDGERLFRDHESVDTSLEDDFTRSTIFDAIRAGKLTGVTHVIQCRDGNIRPYREGVDVIVPLPEPVTA